MNTEIIKSRAYCYTVDGVCTDPTEAWLLAERIQTYLDTHAVTVGLPAPCSVCSHTAIYTLDSKTYCDKCLLETETAAPATEIPQPIEAPPQQALQDIVEAARHFESAMPTEDPAEDPTPKRKSGCLSIFRGCRAKKTHSV